MVNPALAGVQASLSEAGRKQRAAEQAEQAGTIETGRANPTPPRDNPGPGGTGEGTSANPTGGSTPNPPYIPGTGSANPGNQEPPDTNQPPPPQDPRGQS